MTFRILIPVWKREHVTKFCFDRMLKHPDHKIDVTCIISEESYKKICDDYGFDWVWAENDPLGAKINTGLKHCLKYDFDYLMMMNSDGVIKPELLDYYKPFFENNEPYFGVNRVTYVDFYTNQAVDKVYEFAVLGTGKMISREVLEKSTLLYHPDRNRSLDDGMLDRMINLKYWPKIVKYEGQLVYDYKSEVNIHPFEEFKDRCKKVCYEPEQKQESLIEK